MMSKGESSAFAQAFYPLTQNKQMGRRRVYVNTA